MAPEGISVLLWSWPTVTETSGHTGRHILIRFSVEGAETHQNAERFYFQQGGQRVRVWRGREEGRFTAPQTAFLSEIRGT